MNTNEEAVTTLEQTLSKPLSQRARVVLTAGCSIALTLVIWVLLVSLLDRPLRSFGLRSFGNLVWTGSLWLSALLSTGIVAHSRYAVRPVLGCTIGFAVFGMVYMACEGPTSGSVSQDGDPAGFQRVVFNLSLLPAGVFAAAWCGRWMANRRHDNKTTD